MKTPVLVVTVLLCCVVAACERKTPGISETGGAFTEKSKAPDVTVTSLTGTSLKLSAVKGKVVLLNFWATWCPPCREEIPSMVKLVALMTGKPFQLIAVSLDEGGKPAVESFFRNSGYQLPAYLDLDGKAAAAYGVTGFPETFIIDRSGIIVKKVVGPLDWSAPETVSFLEELMK